MKTAMLDKHSLSHEIQQIFAEVTRYPLEILEEGASLEDDLGIDSVKLAEVFSVIRAKYSLSPDLIIPPEKLKTIASIAGVLTTYIESLDNSAAFATSLDNLAPVQISQVKSGNTPMDIRVLQKELQEIFAQVTRYPLEILESDANFEDDLGIDSVKLAEAFSVIRTKYNLPADLVIPPESLKSISTSAAALLPHVNGKIGNNQRLSSENYSEDKIAATTSATKVSEKNLESVSTWAEDLIPYFNEKIPSEQNPVSEKYLGNVISDTSNANKLRENLLKNKVVLVTGSGRGLGKTIATTLAGQGATVIVNSFHSKEQGETTIREITAKGGKAHHIWGSVANPEQVEAIFKEIELMYGGLDYLVANSSNGMLAKLEDLKVEHWEKAYRTNVIGLHQCALHAVNLMKKKGKGKIITLSSPASQGYVDYFACMGSVKAAVESLTKSMAVEFAPYNVQVNCVSPGPLHGELLSKWPESERLIKEWESKTLFHRLCNGQDVAHFVTYLLQEEVVMFNGNILVMDGGISARGF